MNSLTRQQRKALMTQAHKLKPVVRIGQKGLTESVLAETDGSLTTHELIKVHIQAGREQRALLAAELAESSGALLLNSIGKIFTLYRQNTE
ncbi:MAG: YhbY family RNA-binding protein [Mariprofundales bacterium]